VIIVKPLPINVTTAQNPEFSRVYNTKAATIPIPIIPRPTPGLTAASGSAVALAVSEAMAADTRLEAEATALGSGLFATLLQILGARSLALEISSWEHWPVSKTQVPMDVMKVCLLLPQMHLKSVGAQPADSAAELRQPMAQVGSWATRSGRESDVAFWAVAVAARKRDSAMVLKCMIPDRYWGCFRLTATDISLFGLNIFM